MTTKTDIELVDDLDYVCLRLMQRSVLLNRISWALHDAMGMIPAGAVSYYGDIEADLPAICAAVRRGRPFAPPTGPRVAGVPPWQAGRLLEQVQLPQNYDWWAALCAERAPVGGTVVLSADEWELLARLRGTRRRPRLMFGRRIEISTQAQGEST